MSKKERKTSLYSHSDLAHTPSGHRSLTESTTVIAETKEALEKRQGVFGQAPFMAQQITV